MFLFDKLRLQELMRQDEVRTYLAADPATGQEYLLHWLPPDGSPQLAGLMSTLDNLPEHGRQLILEAGRRDGRAYIITRNPPSFPGLESWLRAVNEFLTTTSLEKKGVWKVPVELIEPADSPSPELLSAVSGEANSQPGEFTQLLQSPSRPVAQPSPVIPQPQRPQRDDDFTRIMQPKAAGPGEFTRIMQGGAPPKPQTPEAPGAASSGPGEFTRLIQSIPEPPRPARIDPVLRPSAPEPPGEFTRMFGSPAASPEGPPEPKAPESKSRETQSPEFRPPEPKPGEFTRLFRSPASEPTPLLPAEDPFYQPFQAAEPAGDFTGRFGRDNDATRVFAPPPVQQPAAQRASDGPGDYTRILSSVPAPATPQPAQPAPPVGAAQTKPDRSAWIFFTVLAILAICAIALIVYFVTKR